MRPTCFWLLAALVASGLAPGLAAAQEPAPQPNVVLLLADDLGWADVGFHGSPIATPHLDGLVREGVRFDRAYVNPVCSVTRAALMTGYCTVRTGVNNRTPLPTSYRLLPAFLHDAGYQTWMCGKWHLGGADDPAQLPHHRGFDHFYGHLHGAIDYFQHTNHETGQPDWQRDGVQVTEAGYSTELLTDEALRQVRARDPARPFFLYLAFNAVHGPISATDALLAPYASVADRKRRTLMAGVAGIDAAVGRVLATLDELGLAQNTLVLFSSDNGGQLSIGSLNTPLRGEKGEPWEGGVRSPSVMRWPGHLPAGTVSTQPWWIGDVLPTLAGLAGVPATTLPPALDGVDLWPEFSHGTRRDRPMFFVGSGGMAVIDNDWKLVIADKGATPGLFNIAQDPSETKDLAAAEPQRVETMAAALRAVQATAPARTGEHGGGGGGKGKKDKKDKNKPRGGNGTGTPPPPNPAE